MRKVSAEQNRARKSYKKILSQMVEGLPSGTRAQIARSLGHSNSYVSQMLSTNSNVPVPRAHLPEIMKLCEFSEQDAAEFLAFYETAHPRNYSDILKDGADSVTISLPRFATAGQRQSVIDAIQQSAEIIIEVSNQARKRGPRK